MSRAAKRLLIAGLALTVGAPGIGLLVTAIGIATTFGMVDRNHEVSLNELAGPLSVDLTATTVGFAGGAIGLGVLIAAALVFYKEAKRAR